MDQTANASDFNESATEKKLDLITGKINYRHRHGELFLGMSLKRVDFQITQHNNQATGSLKQSSALSYFIRFNSRSHFFNNSNIGLQFTATGSTYNLSDSESDADGQKYQESISGYYTYVAPVLFYLHGNRYQTRYFKAGFAPGLSLVNYQGEVILETEGKLLEADIKTPSGIAFQPTINFLLESKWDNWSLMLSHSRYALDGSTHEFKIQETAATAAYSWTL